jgi:carboxymethylenebutenolidase
MSHHLERNDFATAAQPVVAETLVITGSEGLDAGPVLVRTGRGELPAYRAVPTGRSGLPVVLVIQEIFGVHEHIRDVARRIAKLGYFAIAPELYFRHGDVGKLPTIDAIREIVAKVADEDVLSDLDATLSFAGQNGADADRVGVTGFCWGGRVTWLYAAHQPRVKAGVAWYGRLVGETSARQPRFPIDVLPQLKAPVLGLYGGEDQGIPLDTVQQVQAELERLRSQSQIHVYPTAPHAFYADYRASYRKDPADDGFRRLQDWFREHGL